MKYISLLALLLMMPLMGVRAQMQFGYLRYQEVLRLMPEYASAQEQYQQLKVKYDQETLRSEEEFQKKYVEFLEGQRDFPPTILQKRQAELQELMEHGVAFRTQVQTLLAEAQQEMLSAVRIRLNDTIRQVAQEQGLAFVLNTDGDNAPYVSPAQGTDITTLVLQKLSAVDEQSTLQAE